MIVADILLDALFAAVAAIGFGAISDPPMRTFPRIALLAACGHALRFALMRHAGLDIASASFIAAFTIGMGSLWLGRSVRCPMTVLYIPALLPMVPGIFAYKAFGGLAMCLFRASETTFNHYFYLFASNGMMAFFILLSMAVGAIIPIFMFKRISFQATRR